MGEMMGLMVMLEGKRKRAVEMVRMCVGLVCVCVFFCQAGDGIRGLVRSRGLGDVYRGQHWTRAADAGVWRSSSVPAVVWWRVREYHVALWRWCLRLQLNALVIWLFSSVQYPPLIHI